MKPHQYWPVATLCGALTLLAFVPSIAIEPESVKEAVEKGKACLEKADFNAAISAYTEAIRLDPKHAKAYGGRGFAYHENGDPDKAIADSAEAIRLDPKYAEAYIGRGIAYQTKGDLDKAIADYMEALRINPKCAGAFFGRSGETLNVEQVAFWQHKEQQLAKWKPDHEDLGPVLGKIFQPKAEIVGDWTTAVNYDSSRLSIRKKDSGGYAVDFSTGGCLLDWALQREGTYTDGILRLNKPVEEYRPNTYDTLYVISVNGTEYLLSQSAIRYHVKHDAKKGVVDWSEHLRFSAFHRKGKANDDVSK